MAIMRRLLVYTEREVIKNKKLDTLLLTSPEIRQEEDPEKGKTIIRVVVSDILKQTFLDNLLSELKETGVECYLTKLLGAL